MVQRRNPHPVILAIAAFALLVACNSEPEAAATPEPRATVATSGPPAKQLFGAEPRASRQTPQAIGGYAKGCQAGAVQLAETGPTWQAMRLSRNRNWAQPVTVDYVQDLSRGPVCPGG